MVGYRQTWTVYGPMDELQINTTVEVTTKAGKVKREHILAVSAPVFDDGREMVYAFFAPKGYTQESREELEHIAEMKGQKQHSKLSWEVVYRDIMAKFGGIHEDQDVSNCDIPRSLLRKDSGYALDAVASAEGWPNVNEFVEYLNNLYAQRKETATWKM